MRTRRENCLLSPESPSFRAAEQIIRRLKSGGTLSTSLPLNMIGPVAVPVSIVSLRIFPWWHNAWSGHSFIRRSRFFALSKFLAWSRPIGAINFAEARSAPSKSVPMTVTPVRSAPPLVGMLRCCFAGPSHNDSQQPARSPDNGFDFFGGKSSATDQLRQKNLKSIKYTGGKQFHHARF
jgi:hypothetical protein